MTVKQLVATANKSFFSGEYTWNSQSSSNDNSLESFFQTLEQSPTAGGDMFWSLFGHNVPDCNVGDPCLLCVFPPSKANSNLDFRQPQ